MRISKEHQKIIKQRVKALAGASASVKLFGSRINDDARGGDVDLLLILPHVIHDPAKLSARLSAQLMRQFGGRKVDILLDAPNLKSLAIHSIAHSEGVLL